MPRCWIRGLVLWTALATGCGGAPKEYTCVEFAEQEPDPAVRGWVYVDGDDSSQSAWESGVFPGDSALPDVEVRLVNRFQDRSWRTCEDGQFAFGSLREGTYLILPDLPPGQPNTRNRPLRLPAAVEEGLVHLVAFGDSLPVVHQSENVRFPELAVERLNALANTSVVNVAWEGTTTEDWLPGGSLFDETLLPLLSEADLVVMSLGGNDVLFFLDERFQSGQTEDLEGQLEEFLTQLVGRLQTIMEAIQAQNSALDIVYLLVANYGPTDQWGSLLGPLQEYATELLDNGIQKVRRELRPDLDLVMIDLYAAIQKQGLDLDNYLQDPLHFNDAGHDWVADELLRALGVARVGAKPLNLESFYGVAP